MKLIAMEFEHGFSENPLKISWLQGSKSSQDEKKRNVFEANSSSRSGNDSKVTVLWFSTFQHFERGLACFIEIHVQSAENHMHSFII